MLKGGFSFKKYQPNLLDAKHHMVYAHIGNFLAEAQADKKDAVHEDLEYIFQLIQSHFLCVVPSEDCYQANPDNGVIIHYFALGVLSLPFTSETDKSQIGLWNDIVKEVSYEYGERMKHMLRGKCTGKQLYELVQNCIEDFEYEDRERLDVDKLANLAAFVYDYCMLTMKEAHLYRNLDLYVDGTVRIRHKVYEAPLRRCASIRQYCKDGGIVTNHEDYLGPNYDLPPVQINDTVQNPHANDSYISAMFVDLMHKFFLSFGLKKFGKSEWAAPERWLIYELLRIFGLCKSDKPAKESKYVTTVMREYGDYFTKCNLRTWLREGQAYCNLMCCSPEQLTNRQQHIHEPFLLLSDYSRVTENAPVENAPIEDSPVETQEIKIEDLPKDLQAVLSDISGNTYRITHTSNEHICYATVKEKERVKTELISWNPVLDYVMELIDTSFEYITFFPQTFQYLIMRQDLQDPKTRKKLVSLLERDLLGRLPEIPRGRFTHEQGKELIRKFCKSCKREERDRIDVDKLYMLFLFIYDYVYMTYKESVVNSYLRLYIPSQLEVCEEMLPSTMLNDDMLSAHLMHLFGFYRGENETEAFERLKDPTLGVPEKNFPVEHPACSVKNMTAMFFDLFARFFKSFGLTKRANVKLVSNQECDLIASLAHIGGICATDKSDSVRRMYLENQDYFQKSSLEISIRENEYGYLLLNTLSEELFGPKTKIEESDS